MKKYFDKVQTLAELKKQYRLLSVKNHPDKIGEKGNDLMKEINKQRDKKIKEIMRAENNLTYNMDEILQEFSYEKLHNVAQSMVDEVMGKFSDPSKFTLADAFKFVADKFQNNLGNPDDKKKIT